MQIYCLAFSVCLLKTLSFKFWWAQFSNCFCITKHILGFVLWAAFPVIAHTVAQLSNFLPNDKCPEDNRNFASASVEWKLRAQGWFLLNMCHFHTIKLKNCKLGTVCTCLMSIFNLNECEVYLYDPQMYLIYSKFLTYEYTKGKEFIWDITRIWEIPFFK